MSGQIEVNRGTHVATIKICNAEKRNAMNQAMWITFGDVMEELSSDPSLRCIVLRGEGTEAFASGADIEEFSRLRANKADAIAFSKHGHRAMHAVRDCPIPTLAAIQGACVGGGLELAAFSDIRLASANSRFGIPIARLGSTLAYPELEGLIRLVGPNGALEVLLEGRVLNAEEAYLKGIVNRVVPNEEFEGEVEKCLHRIVSGAPLAARWHKKFINRLRDNSVLSKDEISEGYACFDTEDYKIGFQSFLNKTKPEFTGK